MKKLFLMAAVVMGMSMVSCGGNAEKAEEAPAEEVVAVEEAPAAEEVVAEGEEVVADGEGEVEGAAEEVAAEQN